MRVPRTRLSLLLVVLALALPGPRSASADASDWKDEVFQGLQWRLVGPFRGGRSAAVTGVRGQPNVYYFGATGGGVWKSTDAGSSWRNVSDGFFGGSIGAVAVAESDTNVIYVGGGEKTVRGNVSHGDGVWKSTDAGKTWTFKGLRDSRQISRIRVHPHNPDLVYAAVLGHVFGPNEERGVYRSQDGGNSWKRILFANPNAGAVDLILDPTNPRVLYASLWRVRRTPHSLESGGEGSSLWKSTDGGDTWQELTRKPGLPEGTLGIIGVAVSPSDAQNVYAIVEAERGGVFRSRDGGETWRRVSEDRNLRQRAWYYSRIYADPLDEETVYALNVAFHRSVDGGRSWQTIGTPHSDNHDLWIDPADPLRMVQANDGGANVSFDGGQNWSVQSNQPTAQLYRVSADNAFPYRLLAGQQDNSALRIRSRSASGGSIGERDWEPTAGGESGYVVADPDDPEIVYGGSYHGTLQRVNHRTGERRSIDVWPDDAMGWGAAELKYRFQWNFPLFFSPHDPDTLYAAANVLFKTTDEGASWQAISPDLTRNDKSTQGPSGGPITKDNTSVEYYGTIFTAVESPRQAGVLWTGSDDGKIYVSRDAGVNWTDVTPRRMPEWMLINSIEAHPFEAGGLYVAGTRYKSDDHRPYLYRTTDFGKSWTQITDGIPATQFTRVIRADPERAGLLYAGTERGVWVSFDDGDSWRSLQLKLPQVPITDLLVKNGDLVAATQGRSFWILDDLTPLRALSDRIAQARMHLFEPRPAQRVAGGGGGGSATAGASPPAGAVVDFVLGELPKDTEVTLEFSDAQGQRIRAFRTKVDFTAAAADGTRPPAPQAPGGGESGESSSGEAARPADDPSVGSLPALHRGLNRFTWNLRAPDAKSFPGMVLWSASTRGPRVPPGTYQVKLSVGNDSQTRPLVIEKDPRSSATQADLEEQYRFVQGINAKLSEIHTAIENVRNVRSQLAALEKRLDQGEAATRIREKIKAIGETMSSSEKALYQTQNRSSQDPLNYPIRLNNKLASVAGVAAAGDFAPTAQARAVREELTAAIDAELLKLNHVWHVELPALNADVIAAAVPAIALEQPPQPATE